jgi:hypothetical protein
MIKRILLTATTLFVAVGFVGSTIATAAPMADEATPTATPAKKSTKKKTKSKPLSSGQVKKQKLKDPSGGG